MMKDELTNLEALMNYVAFHFLKKSKWQDVSKIEWTHVVEEVNRILARKQRGRKVASTDALGENYFYEHLVIKKLKPWKNKEAMGSISVPSFSKLNLIVGALGYDSYIDFINNSGDAFSFHELKINIPLLPMNMSLLDNLVGYWYCYNRNLGYNPKENFEERIFRSTLEIYKSGDEYLVERSGKDNHRYYGKITAYADYIFIILNSTTFIRQRHFISRIKDIGQKLKQPKYLITQLSFVSTCVSFNEEPLALYELFERVTNLKELNRASVDLGLDSALLPAHIKTQLEDIEGNRIVQH